MVVSAHRDCLLSCALVVMMMESPVGRRMSSGLPLLPVNPRVTNEANSCGKLSAAVVTDEGSCTV